MKVWLLFLLWWSVFLVGCSSGAQLRGAAGPVVGADTGGLHERCETPGNCVLDCAAPAALVTMEQETGWSVYCEADGEKHGPFVDWYANGRKAREGRWEKNQGVGRWVWWHPNGQKQGEGEFAHAQKTGQWVSWYENGQKRAEGRYENTKKQGPWSWWYKSGQKTFEGVWSDDQPASITCWDEKGNAGAEYCPRWVKLNDRFKRCRLRLDCVLDCPEPAVLVFEEVQDVPVTACAVHGVNHGPAVLWRPDGRKLAEVQWEHGELVTRACWSPDYSDGVEHCPEWLKPAPPPEKDPSSQNQ